MVDFPASYVSLQECSVGCFLRRLVFGPGSLNTPNLRVTDGIGQDPWMAFEDFGLRKLKTHGGSGGPKRMVALESR